MTPAPTTCSHDSGSMTDCQPLCHDVATHAIAYWVCRTRIVPHYCARHVHVNQCRLYPERFETVQLPTPGARVGVCPRCHELVLCPAEESDEPRGPETTWPHLTTSSRDCGRG